MYFRHSLSSLVLTPYHTVPLTVGVRGKIYQHREKYKRGRQFKKKITVPAGGALLCFNQHLICCYLPTDEHILRIMKFFPVKLIFLIQASFLYFNLMQTLIFDTLLCFWVELNNTNMYSRDKRYSLMCPEDLGRRQNLSPVLLQPLDLFPILQ